MNTVINKYEFEHKDSRFIDFFNKHGWVVVNNILTKNEINLLQTQYKLMKNEYANKSGINILDYEAEITQWRNLWLRGKAFKNIIFNEDGVHNIVQKSMKWSGVKLLHDHIITKPSQTSTSVIPWHQDSMFWPIDRTGCSALTALNNVEIKSGCLEVIDCSHLGKCEKPQDFMATEKNNFPKSAIRILLPIKAGSTILIHSLCWHRSSANTTENERTMHISLWIHTCSCWRPDLVDWHPINQYVESQANETLTGAMFPSFGAQNKASKPKKDIHTGTTFKGNKISMFNAGKIINNQILTLLNISSHISLAKILKNKKTRQKIASKIVNNHICNDKLILEKLLYRLWICADSYEKNNSRNVFNTTYTEWWDIVGQKLEEKLKHIKEGG